MSVPWPKPSPKEAIMDPASCIGKMLLLTSLLRQARRQKHAVKLVNNAIHHDQIGLADHDFTIELYRLPPILIVDDGCRQVPMRKQSAQLNLNVSIS